MTNHDRVTFTEVAERLGVCRATALRLVKQGAVAGGELVYKLRSGRERWRVKREQFEAWFAARGAGA